VPMLSSGECGDRQTGWHHSGAMHAGTETGLTVVWPTTFRSLASRALSDDLIQYTVRLITRLGQSPYVATFD